MKIFRISILEETPARIYALHDETGKVIATHANPRRLSNTAFNSGAEEVSWDGDTCLTEGEAPWTR